MSTTAPVKESIDITLSRIEQKIDYVNRIVDRIEASEKKLVALDQKLECQDNRVTSIEARIGRNNMYLVTGIVFLLALALALKTIN